MISLIFQPYSGVVTKHPIPYSRLAFILAETVTIVVQHTLKQNLPSFNLYYTPRVKSPARDKIIYLLATFRVYITITPFEIYEKTPGSHISHFVYLYYCLGLYTSLDQFSCLSVWIGRVLPSHINTLPRIQRGCPDGVMDITPPPGMPGNARSFISERSVESRLEVIFIFLSLFPKVFLA